MSLSNFLWTHITRKWQSQNSLPDLYVLNNVHLLFDEVFMQNLSKKMFLCIPSSLNSLDYIHHSLKMQSKFWVWGKPKKYQLFRHFFLIQPILFHEWEMGSFHFIAFEGFKNKNSKVSDFAYMHLLTWRCFY